MQFPYNLISEELENSSLYTGVEPAENVTYKHLFYNQTSNSEIAL